MRPNQQNNKQRSRGRNNSNNNNNNRRGGNPLSRNYESNGPDVRVRGNAAHIAEKYVQLARDAASSGDGVMAENYLQHAEHYFRIISAAQAQFSQPRPDHVNTDRDEDEDGFEEAPRQQAAGDVREAASEDEQGNEDGEAVAAESEQRPRRQRRPRRAVQEGGEEAGEGSPQAVASAETPAAEGDGEDKPRRARRPRRPRADDSVGELPAFLTEGRETAAE